MDAGRQRAMVRKLAVAHKQQRETSALAPKTALSKVAPKRKSNAKDDCLPKKVMDPSVGANRRDQQQKSPPPPRDKVSKGLITGKSPVVPSSIQRLVTHKDFTVELVN